LEKETHSQRVEKRGGRGGVVAGQEESSCPPNRWFQLTASGDLEEKIGKKWKEKKNRSILTNQTVNLTMNC